MSTHPLNPLLLLLLLLHRDAQGGGERVRRRPAHAMPRAVNDLGSLRTTAEDAHWRRQAGWWHIQRDGKPGFCGADLRGSARSTSLLVEDDGVLLRFEATQRIQHSLSLSGGGAVSLCVRSRRRRSRTVVISVLSEACRFDLDRATIASVVGALDPLQTSCKKVDSGANNC